MSDHYDSHWLRFYSRVAASYDLKVKLFAVLLGGEQNFYDRCQALLALPKSAKVLDMCCGTGSLAIEMGKWVGPDGFVCGIDLCPEMIARAENKKKGEWVVFRQMDAAQTDFPNCHFNAVTIVAALHEMPYEDRLAVLREAGRVLKASGKLLVGEHFISQRSFSKVVQTAIFRIISKRPERATFKDMCRRGLQQEIMQAGFLIDAIEVLPIRFFHLLTAFKPHAVVNTASQ